MTSDRFDAAITGIGLVTPAGLTASTTWSTILSAARTEAHDRTIGDGSTVLPVAVVPDFDPRAEFGPAKAWRLARFVQLAILATREALNDSGLEPTRWDGFRVGLVMGNSLGGAEVYDRAAEAMSNDGPNGVSPLLIPSAMPNMLAGTLAIEFKVRGPAFTVATACASGTSAIGQGRDLLRQGRCDVVIVGGAESALTDINLAALNNMGALSKLGKPVESASRPFSADRAGFVPAEGAGVLILESAEAARSRGARVYAHVSGFGSSTDAQHVTAPDPSGDGIRRAILEAVEVDAGLGLSEVTHVNAHGTSTPLNDASEAAAIRDLFGSGVPVTSVKGVTGHTLAAAGAIEAAVTALTLSKRTIPPTANTERVDAAFSIDLVTGQSRELASGVAVTLSAGFGGHNVALALTP
ncbi:beta-ketoacyl-[acyl-carrier-protein] synthase family protein [Arthrobacter sp. Y-9]|uniref:beta-ketoacyl-[acyl-carrier-protein] synthase family protein n=1 Tax=Arthrobacter sp. Y-9 TaxID=3039385 RepID=UPI00241F83B3|nr:beta-ketoacyl-[acyl-carrier-protein] synthase family protein [Arthrobacter sp. Y-9]WFR83467.1 beta-ketoacyl-[acyl-carrier-protein] synthase family protein [Arthrobacter sp. Y-9]